MGGRVEACKREGGTLNTPNEDASRASLAVSLAAVERAAKRESIAEIWATVRATCDPRTASVLRGALAKYTDPPSKKSLTVTDSDTGIETAEVFQMTLEGARFYGGYAELDLIKIRDHLVRLDSKLDLIDEVFVLAAGECKRATFMESIATAVYVVTAKYTKPKDPP